MDLVGEALRAVRTAILEVPFQVASAVRGARVFHPQGLMVHGEVRLNSPWWPPGVSCVRPLSARLSGGVGTPNGLPDVLGMALKLSTGTAGGGEWDILLANSGTAAATRVLPLPAASWSRAHYSSLMPYAKAGGPVRWILATPVGTHPAGTSLDALARSLATAPQHFDLALASASGEVAPAGHLVLSQILRLDDNMHPSFDPVLNCPAELVLRPRWLTTARRNAYRGSRKGRATGRTRFG
ncbi:hypothetical protein [Rhodococcus globerulus]|uniref:hypothetical protein n=1 Tax=Rhodococcus globerulus TaxID=33008 RepID=UPI001F43078F|nr:hypothetical protein [Rhodococcus globerulus]MCE4267669.1 hypothetical protein [Rhodococcus globerulus]